MRECQEKDGDVSLDPNVGTEPLVFSLVGGTRRCVTADVGMNRALDSIPHWLSASFLVCAWSNAEAAKWQVAQLYVPD